MKPRIHLRNLSLMAGLLLCSLSSAWAQTTSATSVLRTCTAAEIRATERYWPLQNGVMLDFGVSGSGYTVASNPAATSVTLSHTAATR